MCLTYPLGFRAPRLSNDLNQSRVTGGAGSGLHRSDIPHTLAARLDGIDPSHKVVFGLAFEDSEKAKPAPSTRAIATCPGNHRPDGIRANHALTLKLDHSRGTDHKEPHR